MKTVITLSGGMDSTTLLYKLRAEGHELKALGFDYGQRHRKELLFAGILTDELNIPFEVVHLENMFRSQEDSSVLTNHDLEVPEGSFDIEKMKTMVVPNRNMIMLSIALNRAISAGSDAVAYGAHAGDHALYPDCRTEFTDAMAEVAAICDWKPIQLIRPFVGFWKHDIVRFGTALGVRYDLTWSCYKGGEKHCGKCGTCVERKEAFDLAGVSDPTLYEE